MRKREQFTTNLEVLKKSHERPSAGDIFVFKPNGRGFYFGLVVNSAIRLVSYMGEPSESEDWDAVLVYLYNEHAPQKTVVPELDLSTLLLPPLILDVYCWRLGYVENVRSIDVTKHRVLPRHCFVSVPLWPGHPERYLNEHGQPLAERSEPCGVYGMTPFRGLDDKVSRALGLPLAPE